MVLQLLTTFAVTAKELLLLLSRFFTNPPQTPKPVLYARSFFRKFEKHSGVTPLTGLAEEMLHFRG